MYIWRWTHEGSPCKHQHRFRRCWRAWLPMANPNRSTVRALTLHDLFLWWFVIPGSPPMFQHPLRSYLLVKLTGYRMLDISLITTIVSWITESGSFHTKGLHFPVQLWAGWLVASWPSGESQWLGFWTSLRIGLVAWFVREHITSGPTLAVLTRLFACCCIRSAENYCQWSVFNQHASFILISPRYIVHNASSMGIFIGIDGSRGPEGGDESLLMPEPASAPLQWSISRTPLGTSKRMSIGGWSSMSRLTEHRTNGRLTDIWHLIRRDFGIGLCVMPSPISNFSLRNGNNYGTFHSPCPIICWPRKFTRVYVRPSRILPKSIVTNVGCVQITSYLRQPPLWCSLFIPSRSAPHLDPRILAAKTLKPLRHGGAAYVATFVSPSYYPLVVVHSSWYNSSSRPGAHFAQGVLIFVIIGTSPLKILKVLNVS